MSSDDQDLAQTTTLQLIRQAIRSRNLTRLKDAFERPWASDFIYAKSSDKDEGRAALFSLAIKEMHQEERKKAFAWTWDCYHPLMGPLGKALEHMDGHIHKSADGG